MSQHSHFPEGEGAQEPQLEGTFDQTLAAGYRRLSRPWNSLLATGLMGGLEVGTGVLALLFVLHEPAVACSQASPSASVSSPCS